MLRNRCPSIPLCYRINHKKEYVLPGIIVSQESMSRKTRSINNRVNGSISRYRGCQSGRLLAVNRVARPMNSKDQPSKLH
jgi:hypothetical protein